MIGVEGVLGRDEADWGGEGARGDGSGDPLEGKGSVDCLSCSCGSCRDTLDGTFFVSTVRPRLLLEGTDTVSSEESLSWSSK
jgi:hypothetical protein